MCLSTYRKEAYVAQDDIVVFKRLKYEVCYHNGERYRKYYTPLTDVPVELGRSFLPKAVQHDSNLTYSDIYECGAGWIHSYWTDLDFDWKCSRGKYNVKAVIPAGTTFRIGLKGDIVSKELYITDEKITRKELRKTTDIINELILSEADSRNGIRVGDIVEYENDDFKFVHVNDYDDKTGLDIPVGIVACFDDSDNPIVMGLNNYSCLWQSFGNWNKPSWGDKIYSTIAEAKNDMDGYDHTCAFNTSNPDENGLFAYSHCYNYEHMGSKPHDWYLPSLGGVISDDALQERNKYKSVEDCRR